MTLSVASYVKRKFLWWGLKDTLICGCNDKPLEGIADSLQGHEDLPKAYEDLPPRPVRTSWGLGTGSQSTFGFWLLEQALNTESGVYSRDTSTTVVPVSGHILPSQSLLYLKEFVAGQKGLLFQCPASRTSFKCSQSLHLKICSHWDEFYCMSLEIHTHLVHHSNFNNVTLLCEQRVHIQHYLLFTNSV